MSIERLPQPRPPCRRLTGVRIIGTGSYVPDSVVTNEHLRQRLGCDSEWIFKRTGILERRHAQPHQATSDLCQEAGRRCLEQAGVHPKDVDLLILATFTPDMSIPSTACLVQDALQLNCGALDVQAACSGFVYALVTGAAYIISGASDLALIIGGDCNTRIINPDDVKTYPLFGDGAGAVLLTRGQPEQGLLSYCLGSDGSGAEWLSRPACGSRLPPTPELLAEGKHFMHMEGRAVFRWAVSILCDSIQDVLRACNVRPNDIDLYVPHQANIRIINAAIDVLHVPRNKVYNNLERYGNTSAGSIPLALDEALADGLIKPGNLLVMSGFGGGLTWGSAVLRW
jgi:3-oxoacyl-[acyl-carrier-protein] synthase III